VTCNCLCQFGRYGTPCVVQTGCKWLRVLLQSCWLQQHRGPLLVRCLGIRTGCPMHTGQTLVLGSSPYWLAQLQKALVRVSNCTCVSMPITASYCDTTREQGRVSRACVC
jgi:hypothetical protein